MKSRSYFFVAVLLASVTAIFLVLTIGRKSGEIATKARTLSTAGETGRPAGDTAVGAPSTSNPSGPSRMIVDAVEAEALHKENGAATPSARANPATPLKGTVAAKATATLTIGDKNVTVEPNQVGGFPRQLVQQGQKVTVQMSYPDGSPGDLVVAGVLDGGQFENRQRVLPLHLDETRRVSFGY
ncbi:MAG TPA: hypothetical protein VIT91_16365, partial [Chthoniobacterales bacterium]